MKILLVGDTHAETEWLNRHVMTLRKHGVAVAATIQLGDFGYWNAGGWRALRRGSQKLEVPTYVVPGNHEDPAIADEAMSWGFSTVVHNFKGLAMGEILELTDDTGEVVRILAAGGAACVDNPRVRYPFDPLDFDRVRLAWEAAGSPRIDVLVSHEAPSGTGMLGDPRIARLFGLPPNQPVGDLRLGALWRAVRPRWQFNGHHHRWNIYEEDELWHMTLPCAPDGFAVLDTATWEVERYIA